MTSVPPQLKKPRAAARLGLLVGYPREEIVANLTTKFEMTEADANALIAEVETEVNA